MAPEILDKQHYKKPADIFSFAIAMYECFSWENCFPKTLFKFPWSIADFTQSGKRREKHQCMTNEQYQLVQESWYQNPKDRISIEIIIKRLEKMFKSLK